MSAVNNFSQPSVEECFKYWCGEIHNLQAEHTKLCKSGSQPPLQCRVDKPELCKCRILKNLIDNSSEHITYTEKKLLWYAAFGKKLICKEDEHHPVNASFLQWLLTSHDAVNLIGTNGLCAERLTINGDLNLENISINFPVALEKSYFSGSISLVNAKTNFLSLKDSTCDGSVDASRVNITGDLQLECIEAKNGIIICGAQISGDFNCKKGRFTKIGEQAFLSKHIKIDGNLLLSHSRAVGEVNLSGAKIEGNLDCSNGNFINLKTDKSEVYALNISSVKVDGSVHLSSSKVVGHVIATEMKIGGDFDCTGGDIRHKTGNCHAISIDRSRIGGDVRLCQGFYAHGQVRLIGTRIANDLDCSGGQLYIYNNKDDHNALYAPRAQVDGSVFLCGSREYQPDKDFETNGWINLESTIIRGSVQVGMDGGSRKSIFYGKNSGVSFANAKIIGPLEWRGVKAKLSMLNLSNAKVSLLKTDKGESWPRTLILDNFFMMI
jgi:hypothetical protein